ncbi:MAG: hypothetical protein P4L56_06140 [Candidatus Sulfopaludibacter sp.]|nr:hypothetical protein [Candidatus Sulfopaludibacter sp.]
MHAAEVGTPSKLYTQAMVGVFVVAVLMVSWQMALYPTAGMGKYFESVDVARSLAAGKGFADPFGALETGPTAHVAPLLPLILAGVLRLTGDTPRFTLVVMVLCVALHALHMVLLLPLSRLLLADFRPGVWAALYASIVPTMPVFPQWEVIWSATGAMLFCLATARLVRSRRPYWIQGAAGGALCGLLLLLNPAQLMLCGAWMAYLWFRDRIPLRQWTILAVSFLVAAALVLAPWTIRNQRQFGALFLVRDNFGLELYSSNADCADARDYINGLNGCHERMQANLNVHEAELVRDMGEVNYNRSRLAIAKQWIHDHPARFAGLALRRFREFWFPSPGEAGPYAYSVWVVTALSIAGLILMARRRNPAVLAILAILALYPAVYYVVQSAPRFRFPILWVSLLPAGLAMQQAFAALRKRPIR